MLPNHVILTKCYDKPYGNLRIDSKMSSIKKYRRKGEIEDFIDDEM